MAKSKDKKKGKAPEFDYAALSEDYNVLDVNETMSFLAVSDKSIKTLRQGFFRRGLKLNVDFKIFYMPVFSPKSFALLSAFPMAEVPESEFSDYACMRGLPYADPDLHPNIFAADLAIPRRSNRHLTIDTVPVLAHVYQVYIVRLSIDKLWDLSQRGGLHA